MNAPRLFPALDLTWPSDPTDDERDIALACIDEFSPTAVDTTACGVRVFFRSAAGRDEAARAVAESLPDVATATADVSDENWAERSQAAITSIVVGRITVSPPWLAEASLEPGRVHVTIQPSMGFGTGHHASTRLCLSLLQDYVSPGANVLDVGTGSGVLALAARLHGANRVVALDTDPDALENARENIALNSVFGIELMQGDLIGPLAFTTAFDVVFANLTGTLLCRGADVLARATGPGGILIASGYQPAERDAVVAAFRDAGAVVADERVEADWVGAAYRTRS